MTAPHAVPRILLALVASVAVVTLLSGGFVWPNGAPAVSIPGPWVHVTATEWTGAGCGLGHFTAPGGDATGGSQLTVGVTLGNASVARSCAFESVSVATAGFVIVNRSLSVALPGDELTVLYVTLATPNVDWTGVVSLVISAVPAG